MITINGHIVGMKHHHGATAFLAALRDGEPLQLRREPTNRYDANAVAVYDSFGSRKLGYIVAAQAAKLAPIMDSRLTDTATARYDKGDGLHPVAHIEFPDAP